MTNKPFPVALLLSDLHLRTNTPSARTEPVWADVLSDAFDGLAIVVDDAQEERIRLGPGIDCGYRIPLLIAGDVFDSWNPPSSLVMQAFGLFSRLRNTRVLLIPGQHDLFGHSYDNRMDGAYGLLCSDTDNFEDLPAETWRLLLVGHGRKLFVWSCPWGRYALPDANPKGYSEGDLRVLVIHKYLHQGGKTCYTGAPEAGLVTDGSFPGFDVVLAGDNHIPWVHASEKGVVYNHGGFLPQNSDQKDLKPFVGVLYSDGSLGVREIPLKNQPQWAESVQAVEYSPVAGDFIASLASLEDERPDYLTSLRLAAEREVTIGVQNALRKIIDGVSTSK